jgi:DNA-binding MarR family transcriptional regulator
MLRNKAKSQSPIRERLSQALRRSSAASILHSHAVAKRAGLSPTDLECLDLIILSGSATAGEIGRHTGLTSGAVTGLIDRLARKGLVRRAEHPNDRRKVIVEVDAKGIAPIAALYVPMSKKTAFLMDDYTDAELARFAEFLERGSEIALARAKEIEEER